MENGLELRTLELKKSLYKTISESKLPVVLVKYVLEEVLDTTYKIENEELRKQSEFIRKETENELNKKSKNANSR